MYICKRNINKIVMKAEKITIEFSIGSKPDFMYYENQTAEKAMKNF